MIFSKEILDIGCWINQILLDIVNPIQYPISSHGLVGEDGPKEGREGRRKERMDGRKQGRKERRKEGREEGRRRGREEGRTKGCVLL